MTRLIILLLLSGAVYAQGSFTVPDGSMVPALTSGSTYETREPQRGFYRRSYIVVLTHDGHDIARKIVALPSDKQLTQDADFVLRSQSTWRGDFHVDKAICWLTGDPPAIPPLRTSHLNTDHVVLDISFLIYNEAPTLGDSLFYVHALNRPTIADEATRTLAQGADSREFGTIHFNDILGVIPPDELEE